MDAKDRNGRTPLHVACKNGYLDIARLLVKYKADINKQNQVYINKFFLLPLSLHNADIREYPASYGH